MKNIERPVISFNEEIQFLARYGTEDPTEAALADFRNMNAIFPGVPESHDSASQLDASTVSSLVDPRLLKGTTVDFSRSLIRLAWLLHHADTILPLAREIQAELNSETAGVSRKHAWGLMLPSSSRVSPVTYHSVVAVRYPSLCRQIEGRWMLGSFASGGISSRAPGYQFVLWDTDPKLNGLVAADTHELDTEMLQDSSTNVSDSENLLVMTTATDHKNSLNRSNVKKNFLTTLRVEQSRTPQEARQQ